jgi:hypothetical protein
MMIDFFLFVVLQSLFINGVFESMREEMIFNSFKKWLVKKDFWFGKALGLCVKCMGSAYGAITFWPYVLLRYGYDWREWLVFVFDVFILVFLNEFIFKKA